MDGRLWPTVLQRLLEAGAADAWLTPILMKKGRPAHTVHVLTGPDRAEEIRRILLTETTTIGLRESAVAKRALQRETVSVEVAGCPIRVKVSRLSGAIVNVMPEFNDVAAAATASKAPVKELLAAATTAGYRAARERQPLVVIE
jgi:uncharacterized protein (DUF111 family)